jgi:1-acyl-sn-glycerol-3-phosphate acyltransferase
MKVIRAGFRIFLVVSGYPLIALAGLVVHYASFLSERRRYQHIANFIQLWAKFNCWVFNLRIHIIGKRKLDAPMLIVSNHVGSPDIFVLGSCFPAFYVSKAEISEWPGIRYLAILGEAILAERKKRHQVQEIVDRVKERLSAGFSVILFPEATATDGRDVIPFKSSPFEAAVLANKAVQPVMIRYHDDQIPSIACWNNDTFMDHIFRLLKNPALEVTVELLDPLEDRDRRALAEKSWNVIRQKYLQTFGGQRGQLEKE